MSDATAPSAPSTAAFEKLGLFYLGRPLRPRDGKTLDEPVLYDSRDLVTHAVCVGMTGSGKTGLCLALIEEAAIDGVPVIAIDPKGDLGNLLLTFPRAGARGVPAVGRRGRSAARRASTPDAFAAEAGRGWKEGLAEWGQDGARIERLRDAADFTIYTPGSRAGLPVSILELVRRAPAAATRGRRAARASAPAARRRACWRSPASTPTPRSREHTPRRHAARRAPGGPGGTSISPA